MKKFLFAIVAGLISALALTNESYAQTQDDMASVASAKNYHKKPNDNVSDNSSTINLNMVNAKALKNFRQQYKVNNEKWVLGADCIVACYELDSVSQSIYYDKKGHWTGCVKTYNEDKMPRDIRKMIKQEYYDYKIIAVQEVETYESHLVPTYIVTIEDDKNVKQIRIQDGEMDVYKEFKRS